jgi:CheY-like chemotaxis protein
LNRPFKTTCVNPESKTVLYVDDDEDDRDIFTEVLKAVQPELTLVLAKDGSDALAKLQEITEPMCMDIDMNMPKMNGLQLLEIVKGDPELAGIPTFILTTALTPQQTEQIKTIGAEGFLIKPSSFDAFKNLLDHNLRKHFDRSA